MTTNHEEAVMIAGFLIGSTPHPETGKWFHDHDEEALARKPKRRYWWRKFLPALIAEVRRDAMEKFCTQMRELTPVGDVCREYATGHANAIYETECAIRAKLEEGK